MKVLVTGLAGLRSEAKLEIDEAAAARDALGLQVHTRTGKPLEGGQLDLDPRERFTPLFGVAPVRVEQPRPCCARG